MAEKDFTYAKPMDADHDPRFRPRPDHTVASVETATAVADPGCRTAGHVTETWHAAEVRVQQESIAGHRGALDADRQALDRSLTVAAQVSAAAGPPRPSERACQAPPARRDFDDTT
ncbi:hypothetical protein ACFXGI_37855 [Streptomyces sp. NPDC059355]|uniref:hypothetical protein n=1 Tax=Streptomyces sp. NPDC059355 TaxID=3346811 RepID=UPI00368BD02A